ncbi:tetratricopeptide repeat protein [Azospirillum agricola]|uniref:tetratricopeptide repeat-containing glycosyltransferase family protein n=1 Tax=Azospirillum agricola TaxID=1720247 RepID=UPI000A0EF835|nr:tetratricopeptide repeat-containing glycosyltransferase family protein [Azospirillum agricola]SMH41916.1 Tetratricopeptide repeat-containing protein [Azospirillum lipoferum]
MVTIHDILSGAVQNHQAGRIDAAAVRYALILVIEPGHPDALHLLGLVRRQRQRLDEAAALMDRSLRVNGSLAQRHADLGSLLFDLQRFAPAAASLREALRRRPDQAANFLMLGEALRRLGQTGPSTEAFRRGVVLQPDATDGWYNLGALVQGDNSLLMAQANAEAALHFRRAVTLRKDMLIPWMNLGIVLYIIGRLAEAEAACRRALALQPDFDRAMLRIGQIRLAQGDLVGAARMLNWAGFQNPGDREIAETRDRTGEYRLVTSAAAGGGGMPDGLVVRGTFRNTSGYAFMVRQFVRQLHARGVPVQLMDVPVSFLKSMEDRQRDPFFEGFGRPVRARTILNFMIPNLVEQVPGLGSALFSMSETRRVPPDWLSYSLRQSHLIVPTPSSARAWIEAGYPEERVRLCPLGVDPQPLSSGLVPMSVCDSHGQRLSDYRTRIANISDLTLRKNLDGLLRVWLRATSRQDDAALVLKLGKGTPGEDARIAQFMTSVAASVGKPLADAAPVFVVSGSYSDGEMLSLLAATTHYWSLSHGEGWDLPMTQAGAMGLTLIAPSHSAYTAYLDEEVALMLPSRPSPGRPPYAGLEWWSPDEDEAAAVLTRVVREGAAPPRSARDRLATEFSWDRAGDRLVAVLREIGAIG